MGRTNVQQMYHLTGKVTSANVGEYFDDLVTLKGIKDFAKDHQPIFITITIITHYSVHNYYMFLFKLIVMYQSVICQLPRITIQGPRYHSKPTMGGFKVQGSSMYVYNAKH